jgi:hypothetical protein
MPTECNVGLFDFGSVEGRRVVTTFDGRRLGSVRFDHATQGVCCWCRGGHVDDAEASSRRSVMSKALSASGPGDLPDRPRHADC